VTTAAVPEVAPEVVSPRKNKKKDKKKGGKDKSGGKDDKVGKAAPPLALVVPVSDSDNVDPHLSYKEDNNILWKLDLLGTAIFIVWQLPGKLVTALYRGRRRR
jgi:hypothetical protein